MFLAENFKSENRKKLRAKIRKLENQGTITYQFHWGEIDRKTYYSLFDKFYNMLEERFREKKMYNRNLIHWPFFYGDTYTQILNKSACLFTIMDKGEPIALSLNYVKRDIMFSFIQTFDSQYSKFSLGDICILKKLEWCFEQNIQFYDMAMGETYNKKTWSNYTYGFSNYLFYRMKDPRAAIKVWINSNKMILRQWLRDKGIIGKWFQFDKFFYKIRARKLRDFDWKGQIESKKVTGRI
jgi:CelD/BcsL family acetyltransferase involved in cellulose biosynthesis